MLAGGCGGGSGDGGPTLEGWVAQADKICAEAERKVKDVELPATLEAVPAYVDATAPAVEEELRKLRAVPRPDDERIDLYLQKAEDTLRSAREVGAAAARGDEAEARAAGERTEKLTRQTRELAQELGAEECASQ